jgi:hypothetical protein
MNKRTFLDWQVVNTGHTVMLVKTYEEGNTMAGKNGKSKGSADSVKEIGGGYGGMAKGWSPMDAAEPEQGSMKGATSNSSDYSQNVKPGGRRDNAGRTIRSKNPSTGK